MEKWETLKEECPNLYRYDMCFDVGPGWYDLIRELSLKLEDLIINDTCQEAISILPEEEQQFFTSFYAVQVKEKYGTLRFYMSISTDEMDKLIEKAEDKSSIICEHCGNPGILRNNGWYSVTCTSCNLLQNKEKNT